MEVSQNNQFKPKTEILKWDSDFFGFKVSRIIFVENTDLKENLKTLYANKSVLTYIFSKNKLDGDFLKNYNGNLVDIKIVFQKRTTNINIDSDSLKNIKVYKNNYSKERMYQLAFLSGEFSRFNTDSNLPRSKFEELYRLWVDNSISGKLASKVFVYIEERKIVGFTTLSIKDNFGEIGLIAVDKNYQGKSIGSKLIMKVEMYLYEKEIEYLRVSTQEANINAIKFYKKNNFKVIEKMFIYHFWKIK